MAGKGQLRKSRLGADRPTSFSSSGGMLNALKVANAAGENARTSPTASAVNPSCKRTGSAQEQGVGKRAEGSPAGGRAASSSQVPVESPRPTHSLVPDQRQRHPAVQREGQLSRVLPGLGPSRAHLAFCCPLLLAPEYILATDCSEASHQRHEPDHNEAVDLLFFGGAGRDAVDDRNRPPSSTGRLAGIAFSSCEVESRAAISRWAREANLGSRLSRAESKSWSNM